MANELSAAFLGLHPGVVVERRIVADMLAVSAFKYSYPVIDFVLSITNNFANHGAFASVDMRSKSISSTAISRSRTISFVESLHV
jgi:hypothetical protein